MKIIAKLITVLLFFATANSFGQGAAGPDQYICLSTSATMAAIGLGAWSALPSNPAATIISNSSDSATSISGFTSTGIYGFIWTTSAGSDTVAITVSGVTAYAGPNQYVCRGGTVTLGGAPTASNGSGDYRYAWSPGVALSSTTNSNPQATPVITTTYTVTVTDNISSCSATDAVLVTVSASVTVTASPDTIITYGTQVTMTATGYPAGGTYQWAPLVSITPAAGNSAVEIAAPASTQTYQVIYTVNGCYDTAYETIHVYSVYAGPDQTICQYTTTILAASGSGGWSNAVWSIGPVTIANPQDPHSLVTGFTQSGTYGLIWTDSMSHITDTVVISVIAKPNAGTDQVICQNTTATMAATGAGIWSPLSTNPAITVITTPSSANTSIAGFTTAGSYGFVWLVGGCTDTALVNVGSSPVLRDSVTNISCSGSLGSICVFASGVSPYTYAWSTGSTTQCINIMATGLYHVTVTGGNSCYTILTDSITAIAPLSLSQTVHNSCFGSSSGQICVTATGGTAPYLYTWSNGVNGTSSTGIICNNNLAAGNYSVNISDAHSCTASASASVIQGTTAYTVSEAHTDALCHDSATGNITLFPVGGTAPYGGVAWSDGGSGFSRTNLLAGTYSYTATDTNGCTATGFVTITQPAIISAANPLITDASCTGGSTGSITLIPSGGTVPYGTVTWTGGRTGRTISGLAPGTYSYSFADGNGCPAAGSVAIGQSLPVTVTQTHRDVLCHAGSNGSIDLTAFGGVAPYTYTWTNSLTGAHATNLSAGTYCVTVHDINTCSATACIAISEPATTFSVAESHVDAACGGAATGSITLALSGGTTPYMTVSWADGSTGTSRTGLIAGTYSYTVSDANGCIVSAAVSIGQQAPMTATDTVHNVSCRGADGSVCVQPSGGAGPYTYAWSSGSLTSCITNKAAGPYTVTITDSLGCQLVRSETILQSTPITITHSQVDVLCHGDSSGALTVVASGGTPTYNYIWSSGFLSPVPAQSGLPVGTYCVTVQDANLCSAVDCITITEPTAIAVSVDSVHDASCLGTYDGDIFITATGGVLPYSYVWASSPIITTDDLLAAPAGTYSLQVTDANGCTFPYTASILIGHDCIWPGDADNNLLVDNNDLLPIGLAYDTSGPQRITASIVWVGQACQNWSDTFATGVNYKYADCNGDGTVNADDTLAITQNFGLIHNKTNGSSAPWRAGQAMIYPMISKDTVTNGDTVFITINLGQVALNATNVYGIAFSLNYDPLVVDTSRTTMSFTNSWLGGPADAIHLYRDIKSQGVIKAAVTRIDHTARTGQGQIAFFRAIVTTDNIDGKDLSYYPFHCNISDVTAVDAAGHIIALNEGADSNQVAFTPLGVSDINIVSTQIAVYPNPTNKLVTVSSAKTHVDAIDLQNVLGETLSSYTYEDHKDEHTLDMQGLSSGIYYLSIKTKAGTITKKVILSY